MGDKDVVAQRQLLGLGCYYSGGIAFDPITDIYCNISGAAQILRLARRAYALTNFAWVEAPWFHAFFQGLPPPGVIDVLQL
jgi:hypothetical protein